MQLCATVLLVALAAGPTPDGFVEVPLDDGLSALEPAVAAAIVRAALAALEESPILRAGGLGRLKEKARLQCAPAIATGAEAAAAVEGCAALARPIGPALAPEAEFLAAFAALRAGRPDAAERLQAWRAAHPSPAAWRPWADVLAGEALLTRGEGAKAEQAFLQAAIAPGSAADRAAALRLSLLAARAGDRDRCRVFAARASSAARTVTERALATQAELLAARCAR